MKTTTRHNSTSHSHTHHHSSSSSSSRSGLSSRRHKRSSTHNGSRRETDNGLPLPRPHRPRISSGRMLGVFLWRAMRHPLLPLLLIIVLISAAILMSDKTTAVNQTPQPDAWIPDKGFDDTRRIFTALKLSDQKRTLEAADMLQTLSLPPCA